MKKQVWTGFLVVALIVLTVAALSCGGSTPTPSVSRETATLVCDECAEAGMKINLWKQPGGGGAVAGSVSNRTRVTILDTTTEDGRRWYKVSGGGTIGWILGDFVQQ